MRASHRPSASDSFSQPFPLSSSHNSDRNAQFSINDHANMYSSGNLPTGLSESDLRRLSMADHSPNRGPKSSGSGNRDGHSRDEGNQEDARRRQVNRDFEDLLDQLQLPPAMRLKLEPLDTPVKETMLKSSQNRSRDPGMGQLSGIQGPALGESRGHNHAANGNALGMADDRPNQHANNHSGQRGVMKEDRRSELKISKKRSAFSLRPSLASAVSAPATPSKLRIGQTKSNFPIGNSSSSELSSILASPTSSGRGIRNVTPIRGADVALTPKSAVSFPKEVGSVQPVLPYTAEYYASINTRTPGGRIRGQTTGPEMILRTPGGVARGHSAFGEDGDDDDYQFVRPEASFAQQARAIASSSSSSANISAPPSPRGSFSKALLFGMGKSSTKPSATIGNNEDRSWKSPKKRSTAPDTPRSKSILSSPDVSTGAPFAIGIGKAKKDKQSPEDWTRWLSCQRAEDMDISKIKTLRMLLRHESTAWIGVFLRSGGYESLLARLDDLLDAEWRDDLHDSDMLHELLRCLTGLTTSEAGKSAVREHGSRPFRQLFRMSYSDKKPGDIATRQIIIELTRSLIDIYPTSSSNGSQRPTSWRNAASPAFSSGSGYFSNESSQPSSYPGVSPCMSDVSRWSMSVTSAASGHVPITSHSLDGSVGGIPDGKPDILVFLLSLLDESANTAAIEADPRLRPSTVKRPKNSLICPADELEKPKLQVHDFIASAYKPRIYKAYVILLQEVCRDFFWVMSHGENGIWTYTDVDQNKIRPQAPTGATGSVEYEAVNYLTAHFRLINLIARGLAEDDMNNIKVREGTETGRAWQFHADMMASGMDRTLVTVRKASIEHYAHFHLELSRYVSLIAQSDYQVPYPVKKLLTLPPGQYRKKMTMHQMPVSVSVSVKNEDGFLQPGQHRQQYQAQVSGQGQGPRGHSFEDSRIDGHGREDDNQREQQQKQQKERQQQWFGSHTTSGGQSPALAKFDFQEY